MRKRLLLVLGVAVAIVLFSAWYLNATIYWKLGDVGLHAPADMSEYTLGPVSAQELTYVAIGDSLTAGVGADTYQDSYPYHIAEKIAGTGAHVHLIPFAIPGVRSEYVLNYFVEPVIAKNPDIVTLLIGVNDIHGKVSLAKFETQYAQILESLTQKTHAQVYAINLPYIGTPDLMSVPFRLYFNWRTQQYNDVIQKLATEYHVTYIDLYTVHQPHALDNTYYAADVFHPNAAGYTLWAKSIYAGFHK